MTRQLWRWHDAIAINIVAVLLLLQHTNAEFNFEVGLRVEERLAQFMATPASILDFISNYQNKGGIAMSPPDRDSTLLLCDALMMTHPDIWMLAYYGSEDGEYLGVNYQLPRSGFFREPGEGGYMVNDDQGWTNEHYMTCVAQNGTTMPCSMSVGNSYISCVDGCELQPCENGESDCSSLENEEERASCEAEITWCEQYEIKKVTEEDGPRGFIPLYVYCLDNDGLPSQELGEVFSESRDVAGNCYYEDKTTLVNRSGTNLVGAFRQWNYDPRYRPWYIGAKEEQKQHWTAPYAFTGRYDLDLGTTYVKPTYKTDEQGRRIFQGVWGLDYRFTDIAGFLSSNYQDGDTIVAIVEENDPNYVIATSTGGSGGKSVLSSDETQPCPTDDTEAECKAVRVKVSELDNVISLSFALQLEAGFPDAELLSVTFGDTIFASQTKEFKLDGFDWRILILSPIEAQQGDVIMAQDSMVAAVVIPSVLGSVACLILFAQFMKYRNTREVAFADWRFTGIFMFNCILLNLACLSFIGENSDELCLVRMWLLHFFFVSALAPLFVKTYRMYQLVGTGGLQRTAISHMKTALMMVPFIGVEVLILLIFTFVDPSKATFLFEQDGSTVTYREVCSHDTVAFSVIQLVYEGGLLLVGCVLAYKTRNLHEVFNEGRQIIVAMYNIALVATIIFIVAKAVDVQDGTLRLLVSAGIAWSTVFSSAVFVLPRLLQVRERTRSVLNGGQSQRVTVTGIKTPTGSRRASNEINHEEEGAGM